MPSVRREYGRYRIGIVQRRDSTGIHGAKESVRSHLRRIVADGDLLESGLREAFRRGWCQVTRAYITGRAGVMTSSVFEQF